MKRPTTTHEKQEHGKQYLSIWTSRTTKQILNITSTAQNETPFALFLSLQFWNEQNTGAYYYFIVVHCKPTNKQPHNATRKQEEQHNIPPNKRTCSRKEINALQADEDIIPYCEQPIICPISHYKETSSTTYHQ